MPAFQIYMAGATRQLGDEILREARTTGSSLEQVLEAVDGLSILGAEAQQQWLASFEMIERYGRQLQRGSGAPASRSDPSSEER